MNWIKTLTIMIQWIRGLKKRWDQISAKPKTVRNFSLILAGILFLLGAIALFRGHRHYWIQWSLGASLLIATFVFPHVCSSLYRGWMLVAEGISWVLLRGVLGVLFYLVLSPIACVMRLLGKDFLEESIDRGAASYWQKRGMKPVREQYERLF